MGILGLVFLFAGFYTIISSCFRLRTREGMDITYGATNVEKHKRARQKFMCKNISYMVVFFVVWFFPIVEGLKGSGQLIKNGQSAEPQECEDTDVLLKVGVRHYLDLSDFAAFEWDLAGDRANKRAICDEVIGETALSVLLQAIATE